MAMAESASRAARPVRADLQPRDRELVTILALDGGGIRGIIPARVVDALEQRTGLPACRMFDLVAGTSTGGIIALGLTCPTAPTAREAPRAGGGDPRFAGADLVELYRNRGREIFHRPLLHAAATLGGLAGPKYPAGALEGILRGELGDARLSEALAPVLVTSYDTSAAAPYLFKSYRRPPGDGPAMPDDFRMWQAARATSAAPTYFSPFLLEPLVPGGARRSLVDGGVYANNPALCALADAYKMFGGSARRYLVVSMGTGNDELKLEHRQVKRRGILRWALPILKVVFDGVSDTVDYQVAELADDSYRFQEEGVRTDMDDASPETIDRLLSAADLLLDRRRTDLDRLARVLEANAAPSLAAPLRATASASPAPRPADPAAAAGTGSRTEPR